MPVEGYCESNELLFLCSMENFLTSSGAISFSRSYTDICNENYCIKTLYLVTRTVSQKLHVDITCVIIGNWRKFRDEELQNLLLYVYICIVLRLVSLRGNFVALLER